MRSATLFVCFWCAWGATLGFAEPAARLVAADGSVTANGKEIAPGDSIAANEVIKTTDAGARVMTRDGSLIDIGPASAAKVAPLAETDSVPTMDLEFGSIRALIKKKANDQKPKFRIRTKTSVLSVRGTEFVVFSRPEGGASRDTVTVAAGQVEAALGKLPPSMLGPGTQITATPTLGGPPQVQTIKLPTPELSRALQSARIVDNTFKQAITIDPGKASRGSETLLRTAQVAGGSVQVRPPPALLNPVVRTAPLSQLNQVDGSFSQKKKINAGDIHIVFKP